MAATISQHPSILSWNVSELINRSTVVCQVLRLPPALRASLLCGHHNALLQNHTDIPQRVEYLKSYLGLPGGCAGTAVGACRHVSYTGPGSGLTLLLLFGLALTGSCIFICILPCYVTT